MNKRLLKRHKRQVSRAKARIRLSEPDVRTPEQVKAAKEASRPAADRRGAYARYSAPPIPTHADAPADTALQPAPEQSKSTASEPGAEGIRFERGKEVL